MRTLAAVAAGFLLAALLAGCAGRVPATNAAPATPSANRRTLITPGSPPFQLKADFFDGRDQTGHVEIFWVRPDKWRRVIDSDDFSQTLIVNGSKVSEEDANDYMPLGLSTLLAAMFNTKAISDRGTDLLETSANEAPTEMECFGKSGPFCATSPFGFGEGVTVPGHETRFGNYQEFDGLFAARVLATRIGFAENLVARITELSDLNNPPDENLFAVRRPTPRKKRMRNAILAESDFRKLAVSAPEIIWPQVLDGATLGKASYYVSTDRTGRVREVQTLQSDNERANDSARNQIMRWKFKPAIRDGSPAQTESVLNFQLNTRAWGPAEPLSDAEVRKLATNKIEPVVPAGAPPKEATYSIWVAIDADGHLIEAIPGDGAPGLFLPAYRAVHEWHFSPIVQNRKRLPYRAHIIFQVP